MNPQDQKPAGLGVPPTQQQPPSQPQDQYAYSRERVSNELSVMQEGEQIIFKIKRHPIGIIVIYVGMGLVIVLLAVLAFGASRLFGDSGGQVGAVSSVVFLLLTTIFIVYGLLATHVYWGNSWILTSDSITQIEQKSLFGRESSQLSLGNIENVSAEQRGILTHIFNYGVIRAETAGHQEKFFFTYCPNPNYYAQKILETREAMHAPSHGG